MGKQKWKGVLGLGVAREYSVAPVCVKCSVLQYRSVFGPEKQNGPLDNLVIITYSKAEKSKLFDIHMQ